ncbi:response regulator transcription factor [Burkholderia cepacia]|uniref:response regulator transcription factor n=1 Tax=Burkholderia cepacia TaxID=292 RepID=UPI001C94BEF5|nr:response regulator transcription factor [Burkholderia cepacia]MBY4806084.1 response regulator transcription factor [Burkholderia cepacia]
MKILILEDDIAHANFVLDTLHRHGHEVQFASDGARAVRFLEKSVFDLVILDWVVPVISGLDVLHWIRANLSLKVLVLFLTNRPFEQHIAEALNAGADDYVVKPVGSNELIARINALARRVNTDCEQQETIVVGDYMVDNNGKSIYLKGEKIALTQKEFEIVSALFRSVGRVVPRDYLIKLIWGRSGDMLSRSLDTHIYRVRSKLALSAQNGVALKSVYTIGYRLEKA